MDADQKFRGTCQAMNYGGVMEAAARNLQKEMVADKLKEIEANKWSHINMDDFADDPELEKLHELRMKQLKENQEKRTQMSLKGHGEYQEIKEEDFLETVTKSERVVVHFCQDEFMRCKIMDKHLKILCQKYFDTRFTKINAAEAAFFVHKLGVQVLPCAIFFKDGVAVDRVVGFEELGGTDDFRTSRLEDRLLAFSIVKAKIKNPDSDNEAEQRRAIYSTERVYNASDDEDSDFSD